MNTQGLTPHTPNEIDSPGELPAGFTPRRTSLRGMAVTAVLMTVVLIILTGFVYPMAMLGISQLFFNHQANGSLIKVNGKVVGSSLIGQEFNTPKYFWDRLSAAGTGYNAESSGGTTLGQPTRSSCRIPSRRRILSVRSTACPRIISFHRMPF